MRITPALLAAAVLLAGCTAAPPAPGPRAHASAGPTPGASALTPAPTPTVDPTVRARRLLTDPATAATAPPAVLREAVSTARDDDLEGLVDVAWQPTVTTGLPDWPVLTGQATIRLDGTVDLDVVLAVPPDDDGQLVLRWLPAATALGDAVDALTVSVDGSPADVEVDRSGARLLLPVTRGPHVVRVVASYRVPERTAIADDGTPAGYGLLSRTSEALMLGHWLPLVALPGDDGPMQARGDVGAFPAAAFSVVVDHEGTVVSGGEERPCPTPRDGCTWLQGLGVRDLAVVALADAATATAPGAAVHLDAGVAAVDRMQEVADETAAGRRALEDLLGPLPWPTVDVVAAPIAPGALGMEFPGIVWVDPGSWPQPGPELGSYVLAHELGHQWFHALVGNGSLSAPVVDESLAQYLSVLVFDALFGAGAGARLATRSLGGRHARAVAQGVPDEAPALPLDAFTSDASYGANVYGRGGQAWMDAEEEAGREAVVDALAVLVRRFGLGVVDAQVVLDVLREAAPAAAPVVASGWGLSR